MSLELFNALASFGTFLVIAATAIAALVQLRHARSANLIEGISEVNRTFASTDYQAAQTFVLTQLSQTWQDPEFRYQHANRAARSAENRTLVSKINLVGNTYESLGLMVKRQLVDREMVLDVYSANAVLAWDALAPVTASSRHAIGSALWEHFEYLVVLSKDWAARHPNGTYPRGVRRIELEYDLRDADARYALSRVPAE
jgi:hypothetical protein